MKDTLKALDYFGTKVVNKSKGNLKRKKKKASSKLINSIGYKAKVSKNNGGLLDFCRLWSQRSWRYKS